MLPAYQGLEAHRAATTDIELRLIMQREFATFERAPQFHLHGQLRTALGAHFGNIKLILILALFLGAVHRDVGVLHQHLGALPVLGIERNAERRRDEQLLALADEGLGEGAAHLVHDRRHLFYIEGMIEDHHELIAAAAADGVGGAQPRTQPLRYLAQQGIARGVAEGVDDTFEIVEVQEQHGDGDLLPLGREQGRLQPIVQQDAVGQARETVVGREVPQLLLKAFTLAHIARDGRIELHRAVRVVMRLDELRNENLRAVTCEQRTFAAPHAVAVGDGQGVAEEEGGPGWAQLKQPRRGDRAACLAHSWWRRCRWWPPASRRVAHGLAPCASARAAPRPLAARAPPPAAGACSSPSRTNPARPRARPTQQYLRRSCTNRRRTESRNPT